MSPGPLGPKTPKTLAQSETFLLLWPRSGRCKWQGGRRESTRPSLECRSRISTVQSLLQRPGGTMFDPKLLSKMLSASLLLKQGRRTPQRQPYGATKNTKGFPQIASPGSFGIHDHLEVQLRAAWTRHLELRGDQDLRLVVELVGIHHPVDVLHVRRTADLLGLMKHVHPESIPEPVDVRECRRNFRDLVALREQVFLAEFDDLLLRNFLTCLWKKAVHGHNWRRERKLRCRAFPRPIR